MQRRALNRLGFTLLGMTNNFGFSMMLSAAFDLLKVKQPLTQTEPLLFDAAAASNVTIAAAVKQPQRFCNEYSTATILMADILPCMIVKMIYPMLLVKVRTSAKISVVVFFTGAAFALVAFAESRPLVFLGVVFSSFANGIGDSTIIGMTPLYKEVALSGWGIGTGAAGIACGLFYAFMTMAGFSIRCIMLLCCFVPFTMAVTYAYLIKPADSDATHAPIATISDKPIANCHNGDKRRPSASTTNDDADIETCSSNLSTTDSQHSSTSNTNDVAILQPHKQFERTIKLSSSKQSTGNCAINNLPANIEGLSSNGSLKLKPVLSSDNNTSSFVSIKLNEHFDDVDVDELKKAHKQQQKQHNKKQAAQLGELPLSGREKLDMLPSLFARFFMPLFLTYFSQYFINQGLFELIYFPQTSYFSHSEQYIWFQVAYEIGVFISRSSIEVIQIPNLWAMTICQFSIMTLFLLHTLKLVPMPSFYFVVVVILLEGLVGGFAYMNTYYKMDKELPERQKQYAISIVTNCDTLGVVAAAALAMPVHHQLCKLYD